MLLIKTLHKLLAVVQVAGDFYNVLCHEFAKLVDQTVILTPPKS